MGMDKASLRIHGETMVDRIGRLLGEVGVPLTILGPQGKPDSQPLAGPLVALSEFSPTAPSVLVVSCDIPGFNPRLVEFLHRQKGDFDAAIPNLEGRLQPLCGLYSSNAFQDASALVRQGETRVMRWLECLRVKAIEPENFVRAGLDPDCARGANTRAEWEALTLNRQ